MLGEMAMSERIRIAIDGPAAAGKSTVAKKIAEKLSIVYIDTGAMYRALTLKAIRDNINVEDEKSLVQLLKKTDITLSQNGIDKNQVVLMDGEDVTAEIRTHQVSNAVSYIAKHPAVRSIMVQRQKELAENISVVMDGRDVGTYVLPDAEVKIFLLASVEERANRRHAENKRKGFSSDFNKLKQEIKERDERDANRAVSPLIQAKDAIPIDTTTLTIHEVVEKILETIHNHMNLNKE